MKIENGSGYQMKKLLKNSIAAESYPVGVYTQQLNIPTSLVMKKHVPLRQKSNQSKSNLEMISIQRP